MNRKRSCARGFAFATAGLLCVLLVGGPVGDAAAQAKPEGEMRWALYVTLSAAWLDPAEVIGQLTPFWVLYAIHDAWPSGVGPRVEEPALMLINPYPWSAPLEEVRLRKQ